jgi:hypothetical protein
MPTDNEAVGISVAMIIGLSRWSSFRLWCQQVAPATTLLAPPRTQRAHVRTPILPPSLVFRYRTYTVCRCSRIQNARVPRRVEDLGCFKFNHWVRCCVVPSLSLSLLLYVCVGRRTRPGRTRRMLREERRKTLKHHVTVDGFGPQIIVGLHACPALHFSGRDTVRGHERNRRRVVRTFLLGSHSVFPGAGCDKLIQRIV